MSAKPTTPPRLPEVGEYVRNHGTLHSVAAPRPVPPPPKEYIFEEITARAELRRAGEVLKTLSEINDFYGLGTSVSTCIKGMQEYAKVHAITPESEVEVIVIKVVSYYRMVPTRDANFYNSEFYDFEAAPHAQWNVPETRESVVWSSRAPEKEYRG